MIASGIPTVDPRFGWKTALAVLRAKTRLDMAQVLLSPAYPVLLLFGLIFSITGVRDLSPAWDTPSLPVTRLLVQLLLENYGLIPLIVAIYYSGELVWRERDHNLNEIIGASAIPDWAYVVSKTLALSFVLLSTLLVSVIGAIGIQLFHGYTQLELSHYLLWYVLPKAVDYVLIATLAIFVQTISPHKIVGWGGMLLFILSGTDLWRSGWLGTGDHLLTYAEGPAVPLSDMNGQGYFWIGAWSFRAYWTAFALILLVLSHALWPRGTETRLRVRLQRLPRRLHGPAGSVAAGAGIAFAGIGAWCFLNTHVWNSYRTPRDSDRYLADYERQLLPYENTLQPSVTAVRLKADLWPQDRKLVAHGTLDLVNNQAVPLSEMHIRMASPDTQWIALTISGARLERDFPAFHYRIYRFNRPLAPGATAQVAFTTVRRQIGFRNNDNDTHIVENGTFIHNLDLLPVIGMSRSRLLEDPDTRRRYGLPEELHSAAVEDLASARQNQLHSDWIKTDITLTTDADQTPIAPGNKVSDIVQGRRRSARFVTDVPIQNYFSIQSGRYRERHVLHGGVDLAVYYDAQHGRNVDRMLAAAARAIDTYRADFGPYQFRYARIVEFPAYVSAAVSFAGTFPYSEGFGFIADLSDPGRINYVAQVVSHELAHQYWGHQATPADMQGALMLSEALAHDSASLVLEKTDGRDQVRRYLMQERDKYLLARGFDKKDEVPLARVDHQSHIAYQKGGLVLHRLRQVLGTDRVNAALRRYLARFRFRPAPWPRSLDLIAEFRNGASPAENQLITDLFEKITLYDIKTKAARVRKLPSGQYETTLTVEAHKYYADGRGKETEAPLAEPIGFGLFSARPEWGAFDAKEVLALRRVAIRSGTQQIKFVTDPKPGFAGVDPFEVLIDRNSVDDVVTTTG